MVRKVLIFMLFFALFMSVDALADDGGPEYDGGGYLDIKAFPLSETIKIGKNFEFRLELINMSSKKIQLREICQVFSGCRISSFSLGYDLGGFQDTIEAGKKLTLRLKTGVPYTVDWYEENGEYFADFDLIINYSVDEFTDTLEETGEPYYGHENTGFEKRPLKITNIKNGNELVDLSLKATEDLILIEDYFWWVNYYGGISHEIRIKNISDKTIDSLFIRDDISSNDGLVQIPANIVYEDTVSTEYYLDYKDVSDKMTAEYKLIFQREGQYYVSSIKSECPASVVSRPKVTFSNVMQFKGGKGTERLKVVNSSKDEYVKFFVMATENRSISDYDILLNLPFTFKPDDKYFTDFSLPVPKDNYIFFGYVEDNILYTWQLESNNDFDTFVHSYQGSMDVSSLFDRLAEKGGSSPAIPTSLPTANKTYFDSPAPDGIPDTAIEVNSIKETSSIPFWVWIALVAAAVGAGFAIYALTNKSKDNEVDNLPH